MRRPSLVRLVSRIRPRRPRSLDQARPLYLCFVLVLLCVAVVRINHVFPPKHSRARLNLVLAHSPRWMSNYARVIAPQHGNWGQAESIPSLRRAYSPLTFDTPELSPPNATSGDMGPALLMLHVFSMPREKSRRRRDLIRQHSPMLSIPKRYQHLVDFKFVLGRWERAAHMSVTEWAAIEEEERETQAEQAKYGDMIRLEGLKGGENMNQGKTLSWLKWVGRPNGREAQWVMKCDDDTLPLLPNLLPYLLKQDSRLPTYIGTALGHFGGYVYYFEGMMYGFNWSVVKTLATAELGDSVLQRNFDEDAYIGLLMFNLPPKPGMRQDESELLRLQDPSDGGPAVPISPDPRTGLIRIDFSNRAGSPDQPWIAGYRRALAWHYLKDDNWFLRVRETAVRGFRSQGRDFVWDPPSSFKRLAMPTK